MGSFDFFVKGIGALRGVGGDVVLCGQRGKVAFTGGVALLEKNRIPVSVGAFDVAVAGIITGFSGAQIFFGDNKARELMPVAVDDDGAVGHVNNRVPVRVKVEDNGLRFPCTGSYVRKSLVGSCFENVHVAFGSHVENKERAILVDGMLVAVCVRDELGRGVRRVDVDNHFVDGVKRSFVIGAAV